MACRTSIIAMLPKATAKETGRSASAAFVVFAENRKIVTPYPNPCFQLNSHDKASHKATIVAPGPRNLANSCATNSSKVGKSVIRTVPQSRPATSVVSANRP
jgi:hypothetical protein